MEVPRTATAHRHAMSALRFGPPVRIASDARMPGDKSISHRAVLLAACARGQTRIDGLNRGADVLATLSALRSFGVAITDDGDRVTIEGSDFAGAANAIDCGNSGTTIRLLMGAIAGRTACVLDGDASLRRRPMERVASPLRLMGACIETAPGGGPPVIMRVSGERLRSIDFEQSVASAQVKSAVLLAGLRAAGVTTVRGPHISRDHTERMLRAMGAQIHVEALAVSVRSGPLHAIEHIRVPGDPSAALFFVVAAACSPRTTLSIPEVCVNPTRIAAFDVARAMGVILSIRSLTERNGEPRATISVTGGGALRAVEIAGSQVPGLIDEIPALCALATLAQGEFSVRGAGELRFKESDRIKSTVTMLRSFGALATELEDGIVVRGGAALHSPGCVDTGGDHRIGMTAAALAAAIGEPIELLDADCIGTSFPDFATSWHEAFGASVS